MPKASTPTVISRTESWRGDSIKVHGKPTLLPREVFNALERAAGQKRMTVQELVDYTTKHLNQSATTRALRGLVKPYLPEGWRFIGAGG
jgi:hypothetical protein